MPDEQMTTMLEKVLKAQKFQVGAWQEVIKAARAFNLMKTVAKTVDENGCLNHYHKSDQEILVKQFHFDLMQAIEKACIEDSLVGAAISNKE